MIHQCPMLNLVTIPYIQTRTDFITVLPTEMKLLLNLELAM